MNRQLKIFVMMACLLTCVAAFFALVVVLPQVAIGSLLGILFVAIYKIAAQYVDMEGGS